MRSADRYDQRHDKHPQRAAKACEAHREIGFGVHGNPLIVLRVALQGPLSSLSTNAFVSNLVPKGMITRLN